MIAHVPINYARTRIVISAFLFSIVAFGQNISSSVKGVIVDPSGAPIAGAECVLTDQDRGGVVRAVSDPDGVFTFPSVLAGTYRLRIQLKGFKTLEVQSIAVTASEIRTLGTLQLGLGEVVENVTVTAQGTPLQLASAEKSGLSANGKSTRSPSREEISSVCWLLCPASWMISPKAGTPHQPPESQAYTSTAAAIPRRTLPLTASPPWTPA